jgi:hypothetical protein
MPPLLSAQPEPVDKKPQIIVPYDGPEIFARLLDHLRLQPVTSLDQLGRDVPIGKTIVIVFGDPQPLKQLRNRGFGIESLVKQGANILLAIDRPCTISDEAAQGGWWMEIHKGVLVNDTDNFMGQPRSPLIRPGTDEIGDPNHPIFAGVKHPLVTNCPTSLRFNAPFETLARLPRGTVPEKVDIFKKFRSPFMPTYMAGSPAQAHERVLVMAGHGPFVNCVMIQNDIGNRQLAYNTIRWLRGAPGERTHVLFYHEGQLHTDFKLPLLGSPDLPLPTVDAINLFLDQVQRSGFPQQLLERLGGDNLWRGVLIVTTAVAFLYGFKKFLQSRQVLERGPLFVGVQQTVGWPLVGQQQRELTKRQQLGEPAQALARWWFRDVADIDLASPTAPRKVVYELRSGYLGRRRMSRKIESVWQVAAGRSPVDWTSAKLLDLAGLLDELTEAVGERELVFPRNS